MNSTDIERDLICILYRQLVGREPDTEGLNYHLRLLDESSDNRIWETLVRGMIESNEASHFLSRRSYFKTSPDVFLQQQEIISLGTHCFTSYFLKSFGLKKYSAPFDWLFSSPGMIAHCLSDRFATFLDSSYYDSVPVEQRRDGPEVNRVNHRFYKEQYGVEYVFNHHDVDEPSDYLYIKRCVDRFLAKANSPEPKIFLLVRKLTESAEDDFDLVADAISRFSESGRLLYFSIDDSIRPTVTQFDLDKVTGHHQLIRFNSSSKWNALTFDDMLDEIVLLKVISICAKTFA